MRRLLALAAGLFVGIGAAKLSSPAKSLSWSTDGRFVAAGAEQQTLRVDLKGRGEPIAVDGIANVHLSPDGSRALGIHGDAFVSVDLDSGKVDETPVPESQGHPVAWLRGPFGDLIVTRTVGHFQIRRSGGKATDPDAAPTRNFRDVWLDPGAPIAYLDTTYGLEVRQIKTGLTLRTLDAGLKDQRYLGAIRDPDGRLVALLSDEKGLRLWTPPDPPSSPWEGIETTRPISLSGDGLLVAVGETDRITLYRTSDRGQYTVLKVPSEAVQVAFAPDGTHLAAGFADGSVRIFPIASEGLHLPLERPTSPVDPGRLGPAVAVDEPPPRLNAPERLSLPGATARLGWSPTGRLVGWVGGSLVEVDPASGATKPLNLSGIQSGAPYAWSPDGKSLAAVTSSGVAVYDAVRTRLVRTLPTGPEVDQIDWRSDAITAGAGGQARSWNAQRGTPLGPAFAASVDAVSRFELSPDGRWLAVSGRTARVVGAVDGTVVRALDAQWGGVVAVAWSPDGARLATAGGDGTILLWDTSSWNPAVLVEGAIGQTLAFSPDGSEILSVTWDGGVVAGTSDGAVHRRLVFSGLLASADWSKKGVEMVDNSGNLFLWP